MSSLPALSQGSPGSYFFQLAGGAPVGIPSQLQSPASVLPEAGGDVNLSMIASAGTGDATLTISSTNGNSAALDLVCTAGGNSFITMGEAGGDKVALINSSGTSGVLAITNDAQATAYLLIDTVNNNVSIGATSGGGVTVGTVTTQSSLIVKDEVGGANAVAISPSSATQSVIAQTVATGGVLNIGSSTGFPATLRVSDVPYLGSGNYVEVFGAAGQSALFISGAQGSAGQCGIHPDCAPGSGQLLLGSDNTNVAIITLTNTATTINNLGGAPQVLLAQGNIAPGGSGTIPTPTGEGLYCIMGCSAGPGSTGQSRQAQVSVMAYVKANGFIQMGGSGLSDLGTVGGSDSFLLIPNDGVATMFYQNNGAQSLVNFSIQAFKISGPILGTI